MTSEEDCGSSRWIIRPVVITVLVASLFISLARNAGNWLVVQDPLPSQLDVILTLGGEGKRVRYSTELRQQYPDSVWILSASDTHYLEEIDVGWKSERTFILANSISTRDEICFLQSWLVNQTAGDRPIRVGLVSGPYHMRRIQHLVDRLLKPIDRDQSLVRFRIYYLPVPTSLYPASAQDYDHWWRSRVLKDLVPLEIQKLAGEYLRIAFSKVCEPSAHGTLHPFRAPAPKTPFSASEPPILD